MSKALMRIKEKMEIDFLKTKTYEEINEMLNHIKSRLNNSITIPQAEDYGNYCIHCDRKGMKPLKYNDYLKI